jgi:hypothetical protein
MAEKYQFQLAKRTPFNIKAKSQFMKSVENGTKVLKMFIPLMGVNIYIIDKDYNTSFAKVMQNFVH